MGNATYSTKLSEILVSPTEAMKWIARVKKQTGKSTISTEKGNLV